jgi:predicted AlkP superfamily pyrophosphatase or phosphodiesterase
VAPDVSAVTGNTWQSKITKATFFWMEYQKEKFLRIRKYVGSHGE